MSILFGFGLGAQISVWTLSFSDWSKRNNICGRATEMDSCQCFSRGDFKNYSPYISRKCRLFAWSKRMIGTHRVFIGERNILWLLTDSVNYWLTNSLSVGLLVLTVCYSLTLFSSVQLWVRLQTKPTEPLGILYFLPSRSFNRRLCLGEERVREGCYL